MDARGSLLVQTVFHGLLDLAMVHAGTPPLARTSMGAAVTVAGVFAAGTLRRTAGSAARDAEAWRKG